MKRITWLLAAMIVASLALVATGVAGTSHKKAAGTVVIGAEQEPPCLNTLLDVCNNTWATYLTGPVLLGAYQFQPDGTFKPDLLAGPAVVTNKPFTVTYKINPKAVWSDGTQVTADDFIFTLSTIINPKNEVATRSGYELITRMKKIDSKTVKAIFKAPYTDWKNLFDPVLPKHVLTGQDFNKVWVDGIVDNPTTGKPISNGPFMVSNFTKGQSLTLTKNPKWWGATKPKINTVIARFITNTDSEISAIRGGEVDLIYPQPQLQLAGLKGQSGLTFTSSSGAIFEHLEINTGAKGMPLARAPWFRRALAYSIDRPALVKTLYSTINPNLTALQSMVYVNTQKAEYQPNFAKYTYSAAKAKEQMEKFGKCTKGGDGIYVCGGVRASIKLATTAGNKLRELAEELIQAQTKPNGIEIVLDNSPSSVLFGTRLPSNDFQVGMFALVGTPDPAGLLSYWGCGGESNYTKFCSNKATSLMHSGTQELNDSKRAALWNQADKYLAAGVPILPLFQKPTVLVYKNTIKGVTDNPSQSGFTWNMQAWSAS
jgi:peptide/nickel transport system substrate-binding protein